MALQVSVDHHTFHAVEGGGTAPGRLAQVAARPRATGAEVAHDARQALGPIAGPKGFPIVGNALDEDFFGGGGNHRGRLGKWQLTAGLLQPSILTLI